MTLLSAVHSFIPVFFFCPSAMICWAQGCSNDLGQSFFPIRTHITGENTYKQISNIDSGRKYHKENKMVYS